MIRIDFIYIHLGERVTFWKTLCFFTYYLIDTRQFDIFELFLEQFGLFMHDQTIELTKSNFKDFVKTTFGYFSNKEHILDNPLVIMNIVRMFGILPLEKANFSFTDVYARKFSNMILLKVSEQIRSIFKNMEAKQWVLFTSGLATLMTIEILNNEDIDTDCDAISLLNQIPTDDKKQSQIADAFFEELMKLDIPISRTNWIDLLPFIDDQKLNLDCLHLATTYDQIILCLERVVPLYEINDNIRNDIARIFETKLKDSNNLICKLNHKASTLILSFTNSTFSQSTGYC